MYANESKGNKFPTHHRNRGGKARYDFFPCYPEYLTDIKILVCPSEASFSGAEVAELLDDVAQGDPDNRWPDLDLKNDPGIRKFALMTVINNPWSYSYHSHAGDNDNAYRGWWRSAGWYMNNVCGGRPCDFSGNINLTAAGRCGEVFTEYNTAYGANIIAYGSSGTGCTLYALKEGIERFFITDINNPVMHDGIAASTDNAGMTGRQTGMVDRFNHIPGGANVLFMDGHVEFIKYPGKYPITPFIAVARLAAAGGLGVLDNATDVLEFYYPL